MIRDSNPSDSTNQNYPANPNINNDTFHHSIFARIFAPFKMVGT